VERDGTLRSFASDVAYASPQSSARGTLVILQGDTTGTTTTAPKASVFDPATETLTTLPEPSQAVVSPSGRYVAQFSVDYPESQTVAVVLDRDTGALERRTFDGASYPAWRPGKDEIWMGADNLEGKLTRWSPGGPVVTVGVGAGGFPWGFTSDGRYWLYTNRTRTEARAPDDPAAPGYVVNPPGSRLERVDTLADGQLLVQANVATADRFDIFVVDPVAQTSRPIAQGGFVAAIGRTRVLAMLKVVTSASSGDLSIVDLETGATTLLAENAFRFAVEPAAAGADPLAPGLRVLALVRNRISSPYDGVWLSTLP
jgi:hypothetical protein